MLQRRIEFIDEKKNLQLGVVHQAAAYQAMNGRC